MFGGSEGTPWWQGWTGEQLSCGRARALLLPLCFAEFHRTYPSAKNFGILANAISSFVFLFSLMNDICILKEAHVGVVWVC